MDDGSFSSSTTGSGSVTDSTGCETTTFITTTWTAAITTITTPIATATWTASWWCRCWDYCAKPSSSGARIHDNSDQASHHNLSSHSCRNGSIEHQREWDRDGSIEHQREQLDGDLKLERDRDGSIEHQWEWDHYGSIEHQWEWQLDHEYSERSNDDDRRCGTTWQLMAYPSIYGSGFAHEQQSQPR